VALSHTFATFLESGARIFTKTTQRFARIAHSILHGVASAASCAAQALASFGTRSRGEQKRRRRSKKRAGQKTRNSKRRTVLNSMP
jgi:hypothetical protein